MIVTHIVGGLGNQMFQYAAGKALATDLGVELALDYRYFDRPRFVAFGLDNFNINVRQAERKGLPAQKYTGSLTYLTAKIRGTKWNVKNETSLAFDPGVAALPDGTYLKGYWQCEKYFSRHSQLIRDGFTIVQPLTEPTLEVMREQDKCYPVALHVRRGDMVANAKNFAVHGACDLEYYQRAAEMIAKKCREEPTFFVFSDEPDWVKENLKLPFKMRIVCHNGEAHNYEDIHLMRRCRHNVVANSSFSWWGAWLNENPDKVVIGPKRWFADPKLQTHDLVPPSWITI